MGLFAIIEYSFAGFASQPASLDILFEERGGAVFGITVAGIHDV
jgi:hypothetical protein